MFEESSLHYQHRFHNQQRDLVSTTSRLSLVHDTTYDDIATYQHTSVYDCINMLSQLNARIRPTMRHRVHNTSLRTKSTVSRLSLKE